MQDVNSTLPPGPSENLGATAFRTECPLNLFSRLVQEYGNIVHVLLGKDRMVVLNEPDLIEQVLRRDHAKFVKGSLWWIKAVMGNGVGVSEGKDHRRQRKMMAPTFSPRAVKGFSGETARVTQEHAHAWVSGKNNVLDLIGELTLDVVCQTLFGCRVDNGSVQTMRQSLSILKKSGGLGATTEADVPAEMLAEFRDALAELDGAILKLVATRQESPGNDIMSHLISLKDDEQRGFDDRELRDHAMALMLAGHDSTADAICWALYFLAKHPETQEKAYEEARALSLDPEEQDPDTMVYGRRVFAEGMRLYPPSWIISRQTTDTYQLGPYTLPPQTYIRMPQWVTHRDARFFPEPEKFDPDRWLPEAEKSRPKFSYYPFGGGDRICLGQAKAWMEGPLVIANILKKWKVAFVEEPELVAAVVLSAPGMVLDFQPR
jgi:cytochrome P450